MKLDLCCGMRKMEGYIGIDKIQLPGVDKIIDLDVNGLRGYEDDSIEGIRLYDSIEHLRHKLFIMNECWRVLNPGGVLDIFVPSTNGMGAFQDPTHKSYWNKNSFLYYVIEQIEYLKLNWTYGFIGGFKTLKLEEIRTSDGVIHVSTILEKIDALTIEDLKLQHLGEDYKDFIPDYYKVD